MIVAASLSERLWGGEWEQARHCAILWLEVATERRRESHLQRIPSGFAQ